jgi:hypothetical protein
MKDINGKEIDLKHRDSILEERGTLTIDKGWEDEHYRFCESLLKDFKNKRLNYTEFIDRQKSYLQDKLAEQKAEIIERVEKMTNASRDDVQNEKVICSDDVINIIKQ